MVKRVEQPDSAPAQGEAARVLNLSPATRVYSVG